MLSKQAIEEFQDIYLKTYGKELSFAEAAEQVSQLDLQPLPQAGIIPIPTFPEGESLPTPIPTSEVLANSDRVNILLMGIDRRPGEPFISRTDTMMLVSIDTEKPAASILSIPRDLYVVIPGIGRDRINTAFVYGSAGNNPAGEQSWPSKPWNTIWGCLSTIISW